MTLPNIDRERYTEIPGLEGPFRTKSGKVVYYDPKEGRYYDRDSDIYLTHEEYEAYDKGSMSEGDVLNFGAAQEKNKVKQRFNDKQTRRQADATNRSEMFTQIDMAVASTIDFLVGEKGMDQAEANKAVYSHLSDMAMMHDMSKG